MHTQALATAEPGHGPQGGRIRSFATAITMPAGRSRCRRCARQLRGGRDDRSRGMQSSYRRPGCAENRAVRLARIEQAPAPPSAEEQGFRWATQLRRGSRRASWPRNWRSNASPAIPAERPAISECRCATLAVAGLRSVPAHTRNQGSGLSGRGDGRPEGAAGLAAGDEQARDLLRHQPGSAEFAGLLVWCGVRARGQRDQPPSNKATLRRFHDAINTGDPELTRRRSTSSSSRTH
jgi:hypothetical protein